MAYYERDPLLELLQREQAVLLNGVASAQGKRGLTVLGARLRALAAAEQEVLYLALARISLRLETQRFLDDCRGDGALQQAALHTLMHTRASHPVWKIRALQLRELIQAHAEQREQGLIPVLRSQLPRALYRSLATAFGARYAWHLQSEQAPAMSPTSFYARA